MITTYSIKKDFSILNAEWLFNTISGENPSNYLYTFIGRTEPWVVESEPPMPADNVDGFITSWKNMIALKRVNYTDMSLAIKKNVWASGTVYDMYDDKDPLLNEEVYFVITSKNKIYKCLDNNGRAPSTVEPDSDSLTPWSTSDGYKWQLMYKISDSDMTKWNNDSVIPVKKLTSDDGSLQWQIQEAAVPGTIDNIIVENGGSGYLQAPEITIRGDGTGAIAEAIMNGDSISKILIRSRGSGYTYANISINGNAELRAVISPVKGHGSNAVEELNGRYLIIRSIFDKDETGTFPTDIAFRQVGLIVNPLVRDGSEIAKSTAGIRQITDLSITSASTNFIYNETILNQNNDSTAIVSSKGDGIISITNINGSFNVGDSILGLSSGVSTTIDTVAEGNLKLYSGSLLYVENREAVQRLDTQAESYKIVVAF